MAHHTVRRLSSLLSGLALSVGSVLVTAPAGSAPPSATYDALGDSYASGAGVLPYEDQACARSVHAPAHLVDGRKGIRLDDFVACGGARTADIAGQVAALDADTDLVTVSIGGNDIGWFNAVVACIMADLPVCQGAVDTTRGLVQDTLPDLLDAAYAQIDEAAPNAHVVVTGYAHLFSPAYGDFVVAPGAVVTTAEQRLMNQGADALNSVIAAAAAEHGYQFVDVTKRFAGHGVNSTDPWILGLNSPAPFHPNLDGYTTYAAAITAGVDPRVLR